MLLLDNKVEAQRGYLTYLRTHSYKQQCQDIPQAAGLRARPITHALYHFQAEANSMCTKAQRQPGAWCFGPQLVVTGAETQRATEGEGLVGGNAGERGRGRGRQVGPATSGIKLYIPNIFILPQIGLQLKNTKSEMYLKKNHQEWIDIQSHWKQEEEKKKNGLTKTPLRR